MKSYNVILNIYSDHSLIQYIIFKVILCTLFVRVQHYSITLYIIFTKK